MSVTCSSSHLVHLVDGYSQLRDAKRAHQQGVFSGLTPRLEARLELPTAGVHHEHRHVGLRREASKRQCTNLIYIKVPMTQDRNYLRFIVMLQLNP